MLQEDDLEQFELLRDVAEHNAMFQNPDGVRQIREARENTIDIPDDDFVETIKENFGRDISFEDAEEDVDVTKVISNASDIYDMEFDEIKFVPFGE